MTMELLLIRPGMKIDRNTIWFPPWDLIPCFLVCGVSRDMHALGWGADLGVMLGLGFPHHAGA